MALKFNINNNNQEEINEQESSSQIEEEKILCPHCQRTANNGIKCKGICVSDSDY